MSLKKSELEEAIKIYKGSECLNTVIALLKYRREEHRDKLEGSENPERRGRAKECKDLLKIFY